MFSNFKSTKSYLGIYVIDSASIKDEVDENYIFVSTN